MQNFRNNHAEAINCRNVTEKLQLIFHFSEDTQFDQTYCSYSSIQQPNRQMYKM